jgi:2,3-bisphosphoglycerate-independent phosphoglycerate mutase
MAHQKKTALVILDGWGMAKNTAVSAIDKAHTPFVDSLYKNYPNTLLEASGLAVGLPEGQMGNSEVGHMNLGAGRVVYQDLVKINEAVKNGSLAHEPALKEAFAYAKANNCKVHFMGLVSDGGVHSHINHLKGLLSAAHQAHLKNVFVHAFTDGRDTDPKGAQHYLADLEKHLSETTGKLATLIGRYYAMDRDKRWERVKLAYDLLVKNEGEEFKGAQAALQHFYSQNVTDEFIKPVRLKGAENAQIEAGDVVICFNFRTDRGRQISEALTQKDFPEQNMKALKLHYLTLTNYDETFKDVKVIYEKDNLQNTLGEVLAAANKTQVRIAETEKYPHVTFFFSGGRENAFEGERRLLVPSPKVATYDLQPEMSAYQVRDKIVEDIKNNQPDFICLNFANPDMVGHTGIMEAAIKACETVDECAKAVVEAGLEHNYEFIILADHGNADCMSNPDGSPNTAHTTQPVPCFLVGNAVGNKKLHRGVLGDVAPTLLELMQVEKPESMTGKSLLDA